MERARRHPALVACLAFDDLASLLRPLPVAGTPPGPLAARVAFRLRSSPQWPLARGTVRYVGEPVAVVLARDRYLAEDLLDLIDVDYEPLPPVVDVEAALAPEAPRLFEEWEDNVSVAFETVVGEPERALAGAAVRVCERFRVPRAAGVPLEPRGVVAALDPRGRLTVWGSTQVPHWLQRTLAEALGLAPHRVRVVAPDVGGGFGTKCSIYPEDVLIPAVARQLMQPVKWIET